MKPPFLYHAGSSDIKDGFIRPSRNKTLAGVEGDYIFAGADEVMAYAYSMKQAYGAKDVPQMRRCTSIERVPCVFMEGMHLVDRLPPGKVFVLPSETFEEVIFSNGQNSGEYVATADISLSDVKVIDGITIDDVMRKNVQVFFVEDENVIGSGNFSSIASVADMIAENKIVHYNAKTGINPYSRFKKSSGV